MPTGIYREGYIETEEKGLIFFNSKTRWKVEGDYIDDECYIFTIENSKAKILSKCRKKN